MHSVVEEETLKPRQVRNQQSSFSTSRRTTRVVGLHALKHTLNLETKMKFILADATKVLDSAADQHLFKLVVFEEAEKELCKTLQVLQPDAGWDAVGGEKCIAYGVLPWDLSQRRACCSCLCTPAAGTPRR